MTAEFCFRHRLECCRRLVLDTVALFASLQNLLLGDGLTRRLGVRVLASLVQELTYKIERGNSPLAAHA